MLAISPAISHCDPKIIVKILSLKLEKNTAIEIAGTKRKTKDLAKNNLIYRGSSRFNSAIFETST